MTTAQWISLSAEVVALGLMLLVVRSYRRDMDEMQADRDEDKQHLADLTADMAENAALLLDTRTYLLQLAQHVTANEQPSTGRHAHNNEMRNVA